MDMGSALRQPQRPSMFVFYSSFAVYSKHYTVFSRVQPLHVERIPRYIDQNAGQNTNERNKSGA